MRGKIFRVTYFPYDEKTGSLTALVCAKSADACRRFVEKESGLCSHWGKVADIEEVADAFIADHRGYAIK